MALIVIVAAIVLAFSLSNGSSTSLKNVPAIGSLSGALPGAAEVNALLKGIPQHGTMLGRSSAPVTLVEFIDPQCPFCQEFETQVMPGIIKNYVRPGALRIEMQPWAFIGPDSTRGQAAVLAAAQQNRAFNYTQLVYENQGAENTGWLDDAFVAGVARSIPGLRVHTLLDARTSAAVKAAQRRVDGLAKSEGIPGTPTLFVGKTGTKGAKVNLTSPVDKQTLVAAIKRAAA